MGRSAPIGTFHSEEPAARAAAASRPRCLCYNLQEQFSLIFTLDTTKKKASVLQILRKNAMDSAGEIFVVAGGFEKLKLLRFAAPVLPPVSFLEGAMPKLESLELSKSSEHTICSPVRCMHPS